MTRNFLLDWVVTGNRTFGLDALNLSVATYGVATYGEQYGPASFPSGRALNLTAEDLHCDYAGLFYEVAGSQGSGGQPPLGGDIWTAAGRYGNLSDLLYN